MRYLDHGSVRCPHCGEWVAIELDPSAGTEQEFVEDCWVCCRPMEVHLRLERGDRVRVEAEPA